MTVVPVMSFSLQTAEMKNSTKAVGEYSAPTPAYAPFPPSDSSNRVVAVHDPPEKTGASLSDIVISMLEQVDASVFLGHEVNLTSLGPRRTGTAACIAGADYIYNQFESMGLWVRYRPWNNGGYSSNNVEATMNGTDETSDEIYIICAHYDTVSAGPGADDDTSGTVAVIMAARIMSQYQFNHTIKFVAFSGEEQGLLGSEVYAQQAAAAGWNIVGVLNADMISYAVTTNDGNNLIVYENTASEWLYTYTSNINTEYSDYIHLTLHHGGSTWGSDHNSFWDYGYDALFYFEYTETPYYHTSGDTIAHINATYAVKNMRLIFASLAELSEANPLNHPPETPIMTGPTTGFLGLPYSFNTTTTDPDGNNISFMFDWGDGDNSGWLGPIASGATQTGSHVWALTGTFNITVKAKDSNGAESEVSAAHTIVISAAPTIEIGAITGGLFKVKAVVKNNGAVAATNVSWGIDLAGGIILLGKASSGTIPTIAAGGTATITSKMILGFGKTVITVTADTATKSQNATVLLVYIKT